VDEPDPDDPAQARLAGPIKVRQFPSPAIVTTTNVVADSTHRLGAATAMIRPMHVPDIDTTPDPIT
jgi:hypothetical protein